MLKDFKRLIYYTSARIKYSIKYSETCLTKISLRPTFIPEVIFCPWDLLLCLRPTFAPEAIFCPWGQHLSLRPSFVFGINRCSVYTGWISKDLLILDFILSTNHAGFCFMQSSVNTDFTAFLLWCLRDHNTTKTYYFASVN